ncbi:MAG: site-specific integrase [bacterium]|nr:site-specific integrase [bacterium]
MAGQKRYNGEGSIRKRVRQGKTYWEGRYTNEEGKQKSVSAKTQKECREKLKKAIDDAERKEAAASSNCKYAPSMTLNEWADIYFNVFNTNIRETTFHLKKLWSYDFVIAPKLGDISLNKISRNDVLELIDSMNDDYAHRSIEYVVHIINELLECSVREEVLEQSVAKNIEVVGGSKAQPKRELTQQEIDIFLEYAGNKREDFVLAFQIMLNTGMRCGEVLALTWKDIDKDYTYIDVNKTVNVLGKIVPPKTRGSIRKVPLNSFLTVKIKNRHEQISSMMPKSSDIIIDDEYVIASNKRYLVLTEKRPYAVAAFNLWLKDIIVQKIRKDYPDYPMFSSHYLRHTFASRAVYSGMSLLHLQKICGWEDASMLNKVYGHMNAEQSYQAMKEMPAITMEVCHG